MPANELAETSHPVDLGALNASIFNNLGPEYSDIATVIAIRSGGPLGFAKLSNESSYEP